MIMGLAVYMKKIKVISPRMTGIALCGAVGKAISFYIDAGQPSTALEMFMRAIIASALCLVMFAPRVFLQPVHVKLATRRRISRQDSGLFKDLPLGTMWSVFAFAFVLLPGALVVSVPYVLHPLASVLTEQFTDEYMITSPIPELIGASIALWGLACVNMLNYYLPDGGGEALKKLSGFAFLIGVGFFFCAPMVGVTEARATSHWCLGPLVGLGCNLAISRGTSGTAGPKIYNGPTRQVPAPSYHDIQYLVWLWGGLVHCDAVLAGCDSLRTWLCLYRLSHGCLYGNRHWRPGTFPRAGEF
jgi:hypothetical protein